MARSQSNLPRPTDAELEILRVLWDVGPATVRRVHDELAAARDIGYTTVLKTMQIMTDKGLLSRDATSRSHVYEPRLKREHTQRQLIRDLVDRAFEGSASGLVMRALTDKPVDANELAEIRRLLDSLEEGADQ